MREDLQVVSNEQVYQILLLFKVHYQFGDLALDRDVKSRKGFVNILWIRVRTYPWLILLLDSNGNTISRDKSGSAQFVSIISRT